MFIIGLLCLLAVSFCLLTWIAPIVIALILSKKLNATVKIGRFGIFYLKLYDVDYAKSGIKIKIDEIGVNSSFINSEVTKLITLVAKDVEIHYEKHQLKKHQPKENILDLRNTKIPLFVPTFAQFMAVHIYNISAFMQNPSELSPTNDWYVCASANELHLDGSIVQNAQTLLVNVNMLEANVKLLTKNQLKDDILGELAFAITMEATLIAHGALSFEKLSIGIWQTTALITDRFYGLVNSRKSKIIDKSRFSSDFTPATEKYGDLYGRLAPIIPKNFIMRIDQTSLRAVRITGHNDFTSTLNNFLVNYRYYGDAQTNILASLIVDDLTVTNSKEQLLLLKRIKLDAKVANRIVDIYLYLNTLTLSYDHDTIYSWLSAHFLAKTYTASTKQKMSLHNRNLLNKYIINGCAELVNVSALVKFNSGSAAQQEGAEPLHSSVGMNLVKLILNQEDGGFSNAEFQSELLIENLWWSFKDCGQDPHISKKMHFWGTPLYLGMALIHYDSRKDLTKVHSILDSLQVEWSTQLAEYLMEAVKAVKQYERVKPVQIKDSAKIVNAVTVKFDINCNLHQVNCFFGTSHFNEFVVLRLDTIKIDTTKNSASVQFEECKALLTKSSSTYYNCIRSEDVKDFRVYVQMARLEKSPHDSIRLHLLDKICIYWSANSHLKVLYLIRDITEFCSLFLDKDAEVPRKQMAFAVNILGDFAFYVEISQRHNATVTLSELTYTHAPSAKTNLNISTVVISVDQAPIFNISGIYYRPIEDAVTQAAIKQERAESGFAIDSNAAHGLSVDSLKIIFPYEHEYAEAIHSDLITLIKWLKSVGRPRREESRPMPHDLLVNVKEFVMEMSDDPFEVKLRDNFELLVDEYNESVKRRQKLADKVEELVKKHLHLPAGKVEELYANLQAKNAQIYVQRSKQLENSGEEGRRRRLFAWSMVNVEVMVLCDSSIYGKDNVIKVMRDIDADSPWPEEGLNFAILWCRMVSLRCEEWKFQLRDFPQPLLLIQQWYICGLLVGAEQAAPRRAKRDVVLDLGPPFLPENIERALLPLKYYHDFTCEIASFSYAFGPCWEPVIAQCNLSFEKIVAPSRDPSPPLPFWDKMRLLLHGRLTMEVQQLTVLLHASLDPYNTTEEMELTWHQVIMDWTNGRFVFKGDFNIFVRTASKYDDCQLLHLPNVKLIVGLEWICLGDPKDHHVVVQCAPDKVPEYSSNQVHDSFRAFRSQNVNLAITLETKGAAEGQGDTPTLSLYGSTLRWFENLKLILQGITRPTRRGKIFQNTRSRKLQLSRHYKSIHFLLSLHKFQVCYWMSFAMQRGCELLGGHLASTSQHILSLQPIEDGLKHRPKAEWSIIYVTSELMDSEIWLKSALLTDESADEEAINLEGLSHRQPVEKCYCLSVAKVSYGREPRNMEQRNKETPTHRLVVYDLKGAWTKSNRNVVFALFDTFMKNKQMKKNLSTEVLKAFRKDGPSTTTSTSSPLKTRRTEVPGTSDVVPVPSVTENTETLNMLQQLIAEAENKNVVFSDDLSSATRQQHLQGVQACQEDDVVHKNWNIVLVNAQVLLKGCETKGYVILSAAKAEIVQRIHRPVWKECTTLVAKTTWVGALECMQYYATVNAKENDTINENIMWLTLDNIQEKEFSTITQIPEVPNMVGCGVSVGAVVSDTVGAVSKDAIDQPIQLQRIVSRCKCEFFYVGYGDSSVDPSVLLGQVVPAPPADDFEPFFLRRQSAVNAFTLMHHDLDVCTNSLQYAMLLDIINNLLLYVDTHRKEALERLARMRFQLQLLQLQNVDDQRKPIQMLQTKIRASLSRLRRLEKDTYLIHKALAEDPNNLQLSDDIQVLEQSVNECKNQLNIEAEELDMMLSCYKESQLLATSRLATTRNDLRIVRANEIFFKHAQWRLTEADGQIGIADLVLSNFLYTKNSKSDDSVEHLLELGYLRMTNLLPSQIYKEVLLPTEIQSNMPVEHKRVVRIFCREKPPVGGISVKEHFEINVVPLTIGLTKKFYDTMLKFCFPERDPDNIDGERATDDEPADKGGKRALKKRNRDSNFYVHIDDVEKMKERAEKNKLFIYIKIPEVPVRLSYKGNKEKNLEDIRDFSLVIPTLEYHNVTWTWLDLLLAIRSDSRKVILSQAIKQKLQFKRNIGSSDESSSPHEEEDKARMLFGARHANENKSMKKSGTSGVFKFGK